MILKMDNQVLANTSYFTRAGTWIKRIILILIFSSQLLIWEFENDYYLQYILIFLLIVIILIAQKDDLAVDNQYFYHLQTSIIPVLSKVDKYKISDIKSIRGRAYDSFIWAFIRKRSLSGLDYGIEITFRDNSSVSLDVNIYKNDMERVLKKVRQIMKNNRA